MRREALTVTQSLTATHGNEIARSCPAFTGLIVHPPVVEVQVPNVTRVVRGGSRRPVVGGWLEWVLSEIREGMSGCLQSRWNPCLMRVSDLSSCVHSRRSTSGPRCFGSFRPSRKLAADRTLLPIQPAPKPGPSPPTLDPRGRFFF